MDSLLVVLSSVATVALTVVLSRWLSRTRGAPLPIIRDGAQWYRVNAAWRTVGIASAAFSGALALHAIGDLPDSSGWLSVSIFSAVAIGGVWIADGTVVVDSKGVTKKSIWHSRSFSWGEISQLRLLDKHGRAIEVRAGNRKLIVDSRVNAFDHLWTQLTERTGSIGASETNYIRGQTRDSDGI